MRDYKECRTLCSLQLLMKGRKNHCQSMRPNFLASAGISLKVCICSQHFMSVWDGFILILRYSQRRSGNSFKCIYEVNVHTCIQSCLLSILWLEFLIAMVDFYYYLVFKLNV